MYEGENKRKNVTKEIVSNLEFKPKLIQYRVFQIVVKDGGMENFTWGVVIFLLGEGNKEYQIKTNGTGAMTTAKNTVSIGL